MIDDYDCNLRIIIKEIFFNVIISGWIFNR